MIAPWDDQPFVTRVRSALGKNVNVREKLRHHWRSRFSPGKNVRHSSVFGAAGSLECDVVDPREKPAIANHLALYLVLASTPQIPLSSGRLVRYTQGGAHDIYI